jgi:cell wall-associated NlpC family hydrolase
MVTRQRSARARLLSAVLACACAGPALATPETPSDALGQMLRDKGLLAEAVHDTQAMASAAGQKVRDKTTELVVSSMAFLGVPYRRGGNDSETGLDCSGFTRIVFENTLGLLLPRRVDEQARDASLLRVKRNELKPGDLVFFNTLKRTFSHVGIYLGDGKFIHSPKPGAEVRIESMDVRYWASRFTGGRRAPTVTSPIPVGTISAADLPASPVDEQNATSP